MSDEPVTIHNLEEAHRNIDTDGRTRYQYSLQTFYLGEFETQANLWGRSGWEIIHVTINYEINKYFADEPKRVLSYTVLFKIPYWIEQPNE